MPTMQQLLKMYPDMAELLLMYAVEDPLTGEMKSALELPGGANRPTGLIPEFQGHEADKARKEIIQALRQQRGARASQKRRLDPVTQSKGVAFRELQAAMRDPLGLEPFEPSPDVTDPGPEMSTKQAVRLRSRFPVAGDKTAPEFLELVHGKPAEQSLFTPDIGKTASEMAKPSAQKSTKDLALKGVRNAEKALSKMLPVDKPTLRALLDPASNTFNEAELRLLGRLTDGKQIREFITAKMAKAPLSPLGVLFSSIAKGPPFIDEFGDVMFDEEGFQVPRKEFNKRYIEGTGVDEPYRGPVQERPEETLRRYEQEEFGKLRGEKAKSAVATEEEMMGLFDESKPAQAQTRARAPKFPSIDVGGKKVGTRRLYEALAGAQDLGPEELEAFKAQLAKEDASKVALMAEAGETVPPMTDEQLAQKVSRRALASKMGISEQWLDKIEAELNARDAMHGRPPKPLDVRLREIAGQRESVAQTKKGVPVTRPELGRAKDTARKRLVETPVRTEPISSLPGSAQKPLSLSDEMAALFGAKGGPASPAKTPEALAMIKEEQALSKLGKLGRGAGKALPILLLAGILAEMFGGSDA